MHQLIGGENVHDAAPILCLNQIVEVECGFTEEFVTSLRLQREQVTLNRAGTGSGDISILGFELIGVIRDVLHHCPQILEIEKEQTRLRVV